MVSCTGSGLSWGIKNLTNQLISWKFRSDPLTPSLAYPDHIRYFTDKLRAGTEESTKFSAEQTGQSVIFYKTSKYFPGTGFTMPFISRIIKVDAVLFTDKLQPFAKSSK